MPQILATLTPPLPPSQTASLHGRWEGSPFLPYSVGQGRLVYPAGKVNRLLTSCGTAGSLRQGSPVDQSLCCSRSGNMLIQHLWKAHGASGLTVWEPWGGGTWLLQGAPWRPRHPVPGPTASPEQEVGRLDFPGMVSSGLCLFGQDLLRAAVLSETGPLGLPPHWYG